MIEGGNNAGSGSATFAGSRRPKGTVLVSHIRAPRRTVPVEPPPQVSKIERYHCLTGTVFVTGAPRNRDCVGRGGAKPAPEPSRLRGGEVKRLSRRRKEPSLCNAGSRPPVNGERPVSLSSFKTFFAGLCLAKNPLCRANVRPWACAAARQQERASGIPQNSRGPFRTHPLGRKRCEGSRQRTLTPFSPAFPALAPLLDTAAPLGGRECISAGRP